MRQNGQSALVAEPQELVGSFVVEVGERQAWPFMTFCDNEPTPSREIRLYIDTELTLNGSRVWSSPEDSVAVHLLSLNNLAVIAVDVKAAELSLTFDGGNLLVVAGVAAAWTTGDLWWLSPWLNAAQ